MTAMTKTDALLKFDIESELMWEPRLNATQIAVAVADGAVSLHGVVDTYAQKWAAEDAAKRVTGVRSIVEHLAVEVLPHHTRTDAELAVAIARSLEWDVLIPKTITAAVHEGVVTLHGQVTWNFQRTSAERSIARLAGIVSVVNEITLSPEVSVGDVKEKIETALRRQAAADGEAIHVGTSGNLVTLTGHAASWGAIRDARNAAWAVPGVTQVVDQLSIASPAPRPPGS